MNDLKTLKKLREETGAGVMAVKKALEEAGGDLAQAREILKEAGVAKAEKKSARQAADGRVFSYVHATGKIGSLVELFCETDFVARTPDFQNLGKELTLQVAATAPQNPDDLLSQEYIRDSSKKVSDLLTETVAKVGENIKLGRLARFQI